MNHREFGHSVRIGHSVRSRSNQGEPRVASETCPRTINRPSRDIKGPSQSIRVPSNARLRTIKRVSPVSGNPMYAKALRDRHRGSWRNLERPGGARRSPDIYTVTGRPGAMYNVYTYARSNRKPLIFNALARIGHVRIMTIMSSWSAEDPARLHRPCIAWPGTGASVILAHRRVQGVP